MSSWIAQHFLNPSLFWPAVGLISLPIIIHLINRLRYRRVKFAAMEFLLLSQRRSRRRILIEQLLLLLMRIAIVALIGALVARLILSPDQLSLFQGTRSHHTIIVDDSASMQEQLEEGTAFDVALSTVRRIAAEGARRPGTQLMSLVLMSSPETVVPGFNERSVDESLLSELADRLSTITCTSQGVDPSLALEAAHRRLIEERSTMRTVHVLSDFRKFNWYDNKSAISALQSLESAKIAVNLVRCVGETQENLTLSALSGEVEVAAAGVPVSLSATVTNNGTRAAQNVTGSVFINGERISRTIDFQEIAAGQSSSRRFDVIFPTAQPHTVSVRLNDDALSPDNERFLAVDVPSSNPVLIVDGSPGAEQASYIADALAADQSVTGFAPDIRTVEEFRRIDLENYDLIYLINVPEIAPDAVAALENYVQQGGGLVWYLGDAIQPNFYNEKLFIDDVRLFPLKLGSSPIRVESQDLSGTLPKLSIRNDPLFSLFTSQEVPILDQVLIQVQYPIAEVNETAVMLPDAQVIATLVNEPLMIRHRLGKGQIFTCLTSAGPLQSPMGVNWSNWANGPAGFSFVVLQLDLAKQIIRSDRAFPSQLTGAPIELTLDQSQYQPEVEILAPGDQVTRLTAELRSTDDASGQLSAVFHETNEPGIYGVSLQRQDQSASQRLYAVNVPESEGILQLVDDASLLREFGDQSEIQIQPAGSFEWIRSESPGADVRWMLLVLLAVLCILEQMLSARLSFQNAS